MCRVRDVLGMSALGSGSGWDSDSDSGLDSVAARLMRFKWFQNLI